MVYLMATHGSLSTDISNPSIWCGSNQTPKCPLKQNVFWTRISNLEDSVGIALYHRIAKDSSAEGRWSALGPYTAGELGSATQVP